MAGFRKITHPVTGELLDAALVLYFAGPKTETGEDLAEFHVHGGRAVIAALLDALATFPGFRMALPGEFARRSFEAGKIDLTAAEGLADLVDAETEGQRRQALRQAGGALARLYERWRTDITEALALVEAAIDFSDEADVGTQTYAKAREIVTRLDAEIRRHLSDNRRGEIMRDGFHVVLAGAPNAGKSSLLNALARRDAAIVSEEPGTTRDIIEVRLDLGGFPVIVSDTAGIRDTTGTIELEGIRRTLERARVADLIVWIIDAWDPVAILPSDLAADEERVLVVINKVDLVQHDSERLAAPGSLAISAKTGLGLDELTARLASLVKDRIGASEDAVITQQRHRETLRHALESLESFLKASSDALELRAEDLRLAAHALGTVTGRVDVEDVLDQVFGRFCIGK
jgi:tRNA modification GTPase